MDQLVQQALAKWPNVPHCYGWLALDARGGWRMRDERAQQLGLAGDKIVHPALLGFINRNYDVDPRGCWYFQNGPQRVYVNLELAPYVARTDPAAGFITQTGAIVAAPTAAWLTDSGRLLLQQAGIIALVDDRDLAQCMTQLRMEGEAVSDEALLSWLTDPSSGARVTLLHGNQALTVQRIAQQALATEFGFVCTPEAA